MRAVIVGENDSGQRLDRFLAKIAPALPASLMQKYLRMKKIKVNQRPGKRDLRLEFGDTVELYINDEFFVQPKKEEGWRLIKSPNLEIVYEDENLLLVDKRPGIVVHADDEGTVNTLIANIQAYLYLKGEWRPEEENCFVPALCNRIDRNTGGIVIAAKNAEALRILNEKIRTREIRKFYLCAILGQMRPEKGTLKGYIFKDSVKNRVYVSKNPRKGAKTAITCYRTLDWKDGISLVECELKTGRTHQIRAQFAAAGHPLLGDGKYGNERENRCYKRKYQALYSYKLRFEFTTDAGCMNELDGREWTVKDVDFVSEYFPDYPIGCP